MKLPRLLAALAGLVLLAPLAHAGFLMIFSSQTLGGSPPVIKTVFVTSGTTWTVPSDFSTTNTIIGIGGGAGGGGGNSGSGGGGGGGAFATISNISLSPGAVIPVQIGQGGAGATNAPSSLGGNGTDTIFNTSSLIAKAGVAGTFLGGTGPRGGAGGAAASSTPTTGAMSGGRGADIPSAAGSGAGGGGAGGPNGTGGAGGTISSSSSSQGGSGGGGSDGGGAGGSVTASLNGGAGGAAFDSTAGGTAGTGGASPTAGGVGSHGSGGGGGGGSATASVTTGAGGAGGTSVDYTQTSDSSHAGPGGGGGGAGGTFATSGIGANGANGGLYGGGGGAGGAGATAGAGGNGANGIIVVTYTVGAGGPPPSPPVITSPVSGGTVTTAQATISGTGSANGDTINITLDGATFTAASTVTSNLTWTYNTAPLPNSQHQISATETNGSGTTPAGNTVTFTTNVTVVTTYTLDSAKTTSTITLSNGNLTSAVTSTGTNPTSLATLGYSTGKYHFELQLNGSGNTLQATGIATTGFYNGGAAPASSAGVDAAGNSIALYGGSLHEILYKNATLISNSGLTVNAGDLIAIEVDIGAGLFWAKDVTTGGSWNGTGANPGAGTGGASFTPGGVAWYAIDAPVQGAVAGRSQTVNFGATQFTAQCSTNFQPWNGSSTACPPAATVGPGTVAAVSLLPSDLPTTHWHTTARPWTALGVTAANYLTRLNSMVAWLTPQLNGSGCLGANPFPYYSASAAGTGGALPMSIGAQLAGGNTTNISAGASSPGVMSMNCDALAYSTANGQDAGFQMGPLNLAYQLYGTYGGASVTAGERSTWAGNLNHYVGQGTNVNNQTTFGMWGAWLAIQNGLSAFTSSTGSVNGTTGIDCEWTGATCPFNTNTINQSAAFNDSPFRLYQDSTAVSPNSLQVERQSTTLLLMSTEGYTGAQLGSIQTATQAAARSGMLMQSPDGSNAVGGRVDHHTWVDAGRQLTDDIMAQTVGASNAFLAGQYQHSAYMSFLQQAKYLNTACCNSGSFFQVKNHLNPSLSVGSQFSGGADYGYNTQQMYFLAGSYLYRSQGVIAEQPAPVEIGGYAFLANGFSQAIVDAGGTSVQIGLSGQTSLTTFDTPTLWTALGIERIGRVNWETRIGPSDSGYWGGLGTQTSFGPTWITSGTTWTRLAENPSTCSGNFTTTFANPAVTFGKVIWTCTGSPAPVFTQNLTVTPDGVMSQTTCSGCPSTWGTTVPILTNDGTSGFGNTVTTTSLSGNIASVTWPPTGDSQNFLTIPAGGSTTTMFSEGTQNAVSGILQSERVWTGTGTTADATQTMFIYPASSGDPSASSVQSSFTATGTNTYTDTALSSSVVSGSTGTYYKGRTAAGGWAQTLTLAGGTMTFNVPCNFIAQLNASGQVTGLEVDRNVTATYVGAVATHTNVSLTAYTPVTNQ